MELVQQLIADYGYLAIFLMLVLGIVGLPIPDEVMMTVVGYFTHTDVLNYELSILIS
ncbi:DedA family protein, partial [Bacillus sp. FJAT-27445]